MLAIESANKGRKGVLWLVGAMIFSGVAACFIIFMGGTSGIILGLVCGTIGLVSGIAGLSANWLQSKKERDAALAYYQSGTVNNVVNAIDKGVNVIKSIDKETGKLKSEEDTKSVSTVASSTDNMAKTTKIISKIIKADGTTSIIEGSLNDAAEKNLKLVKQTIKTRTV